MANQKTPPTESPRFFYGWFMVIASAAAMVPYIGFFQSFGIFFKPMLQEFGWSQAALAGGFSLTSLTNGLLAVFTGALADRYGPKVVVAVSGILAVLGYLLFFQVHSLWQFYLIFIYLGAARSGVYNPLFSTISRWFVARRGLALGLVSVGSGLGRVVMPLLATFLIAQLAWRKAFILLGLAEGLTLVLAALIMKKEPKDKGLLPYGEKRAMENKAKSQAPAPVASFSLRAALSNRNFWMLFGTNVLYSFAFQIVIIHMVNYATQPNKGFSLGVAASFLSALGTGSIVGRLGMGIVSDAIGRRTALAINFGLMAVAVFWLMGARSGLMFYGSAGLFGFGFGGTMPLIPAVVMELFGPVSMGAIFGAAQAGSSIGGSIGPTLAGFIFDSTGSYYVAFTLSAVALLMAVGQVLLLQQPRQVKSPG